MHVHDMGGTYFITRITWQVGSKSIAWLYKWHVCDLKYMRGRGCGVERHFQQYFSYVVEVRGFFLVEETGENHRPAARHWQRLSHNVVSSTPRLSGARHHNVSITIQSQRHLKSIINLCKIFLDTIETIQNWYSMK